jgi:yeast amino acid transporter
MPVGDALTVSLYSAAIPIAVYAFIGVEAVAVTAAEARNPGKSLKRVAKYIAYFIIVIYLLGIISFYINVSWTDYMLPHIFERVANESLASTGPTNTTEPTNTPVMIIAVIHARINVLPDILNAFIITALLGAANTTLFVASRTLWGLIREFNSSGDLILVRLFSQLGTTTPRSQIPGWAIVVSALSFCWVPFVHLNQAVGTHSIFFY